MKKTAAMICVLICAVILTSCGSSKKLAKQHKDMVDVYETLKREMPEAKVTMEGEKVKVVLPEAVLFTVNSADMNKDYFPILAKMSKVLNKYDKTSILVTGYTDITGTKEYNDQLSKKRAENARNVLVDNNVKIERTHIWGLGSNDPIGDNKTEEGRKLNRRVEYVIMYDYKAEK